MTGYSSHEQLDVYILSDMVRRRVRPMVKRPAFNVGRYWKLRDQLSDAAESPCRNIGEGFSRYYPRDNARFVRVAKGSLTEVMEHLDTALAERLIEQEEHREVRRLAWRARKASIGYILYLETAEVPGAPPPRNRSTKKKKPRKRRSDDETRL
jgi:four helix bundle protein